MLTDAPTAGARPGSFAAELAADELHDLRERGVVRRFARGAILHHQGELPGRVLIVESGRVKVSATTPDGREAVLSFGGPGDVFGELAAFDDEPRSASVFAVEPVTALAVSAQDFSGFLDTHPRITGVLVRMLVRRLRDADRERIEVDRQKTLGRVARRLADLADRYGEPNGDGIQIALSLSQEELASWAGASREATSKALQTLRAFGLVETKRRRFTVLDLRSLRRLCD